MEIERGTRSPIVTGTDSAERVLWPDVAKGLCILLVVLHHVTGKLYPVLVPPGLSVVGDAWVALTTALKPIRMPLFFAISGYFAARAIDRPWSQVARRVSGPYYLYVVWALIFWVIYSFETTLPANRTESVTDFLGELVFAATSMWFLFSLAVYFALAKVLRGWPAPVVLGLATLLAASTSWLPLDETNRVSVLTHFVYFAVGAYYPRLLRRVADAGWSLRLLTVAFAALSVVLVAVGVPWSVRVVLLSVVGVPFGVVVAVRLAGRESLAGPLAWLGSRTLRVYVLHLAVLTVLAQVPISLGDGAGATSLVATLVAPLVLTAVVVPACLLVHDVLVRGGAGYLFAMPRRSTRRPLQVVLAGPRPAPPDAPMRRYEAGAA